MPTGVSTSSNGVQTLAVHQGWVVLQALPSDAFSQALPWSNPSAQYYVLRDRVALFGNEITNPQQSTAQTGQPFVTFGFTGAGRNAYKTVTAQVAHRGALVSGSGQTLNQHFAYALDTQLLSVQLIEFKVFPNGIRERARGHLRYVHPHLGVVAGRGAATRPAPGEPRRPRSTGAARTAAAAPPPERLRALESPLSRRSKTSSEPASDSAESWTRRFALP